MHRQTLAIILILAIAAAQQFNCVANTTTFGAGCLSGNATVCTWTNPDLWGNCNGTYPQSNNYNAFITSCGTYDLSANLQEFSSVANLNIGCGNNSTNNGTQTVTASLGGLTLNSSFVSQTGELILNLGSNSSLTLLSNASGVMVEGTLSWSSGTISCAEGPIQYGVQSSGLIVLASGEKTLSGTSMMSTSNIRVESGSVLTLSNNAEINSTGLTTFIGSSQFNGALPSALYMYGPTSIPASSGNETILLNIPAFFYNSQPITIQNGTQVTSTQKFYAQQVVIAMDGAMTLGAAGQTTTLQNLTNAGTFTWVAGDFIMSSSTGSFQNNGTFSVTSASTFESDANPITNFGEIICAAAGTTTFHTAIVNSGSILVDSSNVTFAAGNNSYFIMNGGSLYGNGMAAIDGNLEWSRGNISVGSLSVAGQINITIGGPIVLATPLTVVNGLYINTAVETMGASIVNTPASSVISQGGSISAPQPTNATLFTNQGTMAGALALNNFNVVNSGTIGSSGWITTLNVTNGFLNLEPTSTLVLELASTSTLPIYVTRTSPNATVGINMAGNLFISLQNGFNPSNSDNNITIIGLAGNPIAFTGAFANITVKWNQGANAYNCQNYTVQQSNSTGEVMLNFQNCGAPTPQQSSSAGSNHTTLIVVIVVIVVVVILAIIGVIVWRRRQQAASTAERQRLI